MRERERRKVKKKRKDEEIEIKRVTKSFQKNKYEKKVGAFE